MSPVYLRKLGIPRNQPEDREGLFRTRRPVRGHLVHTCGWQDTEGLEGYGSSSSDPPTPQRSFSLEHGQQGVQPSIPLGRTWSKFPQDMSQRDTLQRPCGNQKRMEFHQAAQTPGGEGKGDKGESSQYPSYRITAEPDRENSDYLRLTSSRPTQLSSGFTQFRRQQISGQESPFLTIPAIFQEKIRIQGKQEEIFQTKAERVRPNDPEAVCIGKSSAQEPEISVNTSRISSSSNRNITTNKNEHNFFTPESNLNSDALWLQMSQFAEETQKAFSELQESHVRMEKLAASMDKIVKTLQAGHSQLSKVSGETNERLNQLF
ncbi:hypothetical protein O181_032573 [Austropuccinia psidii MF-1]|uniref:Uncharacterized protein n=1 Tax=Austropuccinia psidii MF-1 TaxID=1389203 RepID=A0A9Q3CZR2_9BASI|nr:hypothetical protein [Austropuccinia psidii MF-1]